MPKTAIQANAAQSSPTDRRAILRSIVAAGAAAAAAAVPEGAIAAESPDAELEAPIERWRESHRIFEEA